ncbi:MAG: 16S rRNA (cytosine(967)-C(5))-methyltransferase RsmB [Deltaproteobacteria bacterium]|nr:MAG: 16S rRNA (cytosine(967)-C(5))-methyltransferase RsmB [Deltaproteobacteria bacterium]
MTPRAVVMHVLLQVARSGSFPDALLNIYFKEHTELDSRDRALVTELVYGVLRWQGRLDWIIDQQVNMNPAKIVLPVRLILRLATYQLLFLDRIHPAAAVNESVELTKSSQPPHIVRFVNGVLRTIAGKSQTFKDAIPDTNPVERMAVRHSYPEWLIRRWLSEWGEDETEAFCVASNRVAPTTIRVNTLKVTREATAAELRESGFTVDSGNLAPEALHLRRIRTDLSSLPQYKQGQFQVQDEASQMIAHLVQPQSGERLLDACAGLGVKSTHLAQLMGNQGIITAVDNKGWKLNQLMENAQRLQIYCIEPLEQDVLDLCPSRRLSCFHRILLDAPCSGLGILRRNPDIKWKVRPKDFYRLHRLQKEMLSRLAPLLEEGGVMVYATCTLSLEENETTVQAFLSQHPEFYLESASGYLPPGCEKTVDQVGALKTRPDRHGVDGFFAVRLRRR